MEKKFIQPPTPEATKPALAGFGLLCIGASHPERTLARCFKNLDKQKACAVYANRVQKTNPKVGIVAGYFPPLFAFLICWIVCSVSAMQSLVPSVVPFA